MRFAVLLGAIALIPISATVGYLAASEAPKSSVSPVDWTYGPRETLSTPQKGVIVYCQGKTNSMAFANGEKATPGDVVIRTCRAVKAPTPTSS